MELTAEMIKTAKETAETLFWDYGKFGVRVQDVPFEMGEIDHVSHVWIDGEETEEELAGICAQDVETLDSCKNEYFGDHVAVVAGNDYEYGEDAGELIIRDPVVVAILA